MSRPSSRPWPPPAGRKPAEAALPDLQRAIAAYGGDFLAGMPAATGPRPAATSWRAALSRRCWRPAACSGGGPLPAAAAAFRRAVAHEPLNETAHRELMNCWARLGETARAVRHYDELAELLRAQVGVPPAAETTALYRSCAGEPAPRQPPGAVPPEGAVPRPELAGHCRDGSCVRPPAPEAEVPRYARSRFRTAPWPVTRRRP